jgi:hypothetical protein
MCLSYIKCFKKYLLECNYNKFYLNFEYNKIFFRDYRDVGGAKPLQVCLSYKMSAILKT